MIVKEDELDDHCNNLKEVFEQIRHHNIRLNPEKCSFGVAGRKFLGFMISQRGIEVNPDKCKAIIEMSSPKNVKEVQRLSGRMAALSRFLPQSGGKAAPFYKCLRKDNNFKWTSECEKAFQELKQTLATPPVLAKPILGLPLQLYFTITDKAVGSVMVQGIGGVQKIIYFFSHALQGAEQRYQRIEKAAL